MKLSVTEWLIVLMTAITIAAIGLAAYFESVEWSEYSELHKCVKTGETRPIPMWTGKVMLVIVKREWVCDNKQSFWR